MHASKDKKIAIIGAGISGLSCAFLLQQQGHDITLFEEKPRAGGWIKTVCEGGFLFEAGPRSLRPFGSGAETLKLIESLELTNEIIFGSPSAKKRYLFHKGKRRALPRSILSACFSPYMPLLISAIAHDLTANKTQFSDESIASFATRRFGKSTANTFFDPLTTGIYAGTMENLSVKACFPNLFAYEQTKGSVIKGLLATPKTAASPFQKTAQKHALFSFRSGLETLTDKLAEKVQHCINYSTNITEISCYGNQVYLELCDGSSRNYDCAISTIPAHRLAPLIRHSPPKIKPELLKIPAASVAVVNVGYSETVGKLDGFGHLIPSSNNNKILGIVYDSAVFPEQNNGTQTRLSIMIGGTHRPDLIDASDEALGKIALNAVKEQLNIAKVPACLLVHRQKEAIPQYPVGHPENMQQIERLVKHNFPTLLLHGHSFYGVAVNDCIARSIKIAEICKKNPSASQSTTRQ